MPTTSETYRRRHTSTLVLLEPAQAVMEKARGPRPARGVAGSDWPMAEPAIASDPRAMSQTASFELCCSVRFPSLPRRTGSPGPAASPDRHLGSKRNVQRQITSLRRESFSAAGVPIPLSPRLDRTAAAAARRRPWVEPTQRERHFTSATPRLWAWASSRADCFDVVRQWQQRQADVVRSCEHKGAVGPTPSPFFGSDRRQADGLGRSSP